MAANFLHGVETIEIDSGPRAVTLVKTAVIGIIGTAAAGAVNTPILVTSERDFAQFGEDIPNSTIRKALNRIYKQKGTVAIVNDTGFAILLNATDRKREKLAAQLTWIANKHELGLPEDRRHDRLTPRNTRTDLMLDDGRRYPCRIIDLSLSGAAVDIDVRPALGTPVQLGSMKGKVVRHFQEGVAIEFSSVQSREALTAFL